MVLKKQTVWLLTMLSLMLVLGVYYAYPGNQNAADEGTDPIASEEAGVEVEVNEDGTVDDDMIASLSGNDNYTEARLKLNEARHKEAEQYTREASAEDSSAEEAVAANDKSIEILAVGDNEQMLESLLRADGYNDALVMSEADSVQIMVQAESLSKAEANSIMQLAKEHLQTTADISVHLDQIAE